ncbi:pyrroline-5-carboxylate reductase [Lacrimispora sp. NSJ-141]|uniref:Pyrroline-5-carboxylate reductase n=1 Tax=Lientehia hominis TaxID=2897778 RepID=A0AAP2RHL6_9FIRM|nr:pyrroline-5-carboxylate reductase [Lientehia hominis]MCD2492389.1 pyrroline-5-carboxylate reductase [Lientehia hominis]
MKRIGFIGCGNMAKAIIGGIVGKNIMAPGDIIASNRSRKALDYAEETWGISVTSDNLEVAREAEIVVLSVKPQFYSQVIGEIKEAVQESQLIVSIAPGKTLAWMEEQFGRPLKFIRCNPNTPAMVGEGITSVTPGDKVTETELSRVIEILESFGKASVVSEAMIEAVIAVSGSAPAYAFMFMEAMADGAVSLGMPRAQAYEFAAQAVLGAAKMVLETGFHPGALKDMVCSPGGTTIQAVRVLEERGLRSSVIEAMIACADKARSM